MSLIHDVDRNSLGTKIHCNSSLFAMILAPTRELCKQIATVLEKLLRRAPCTVSTSVIGALDVGTVRCLVPNEGDRLMVMGYDEPNMIAGKVREEGLKTKNEDGVLLDKLPQRRVTASKSNPGTAEVNNDSVFSALAQLKQTYILTAAKPRLMTLLTLLKSTFGQSPAF
ncbi:hypothetical protein PG985_005482 [Apiospora marii]|uniref:Uncharacterized protein n=1 Tax=Apiospora marii TaxID=335849 RepID=A0ABR1RJQ4_9PEZI